MSIEDLAQYNVSSVSKTEQPLGDAAAAIYVISRDDIVRSGAATLPEMLRLAPNLQVFQTSPGSWVVTARGLNGNRDAQSYSNKLLVLVDGRTVYTPLFSGVYWDMPDVLPDNIDRIEVISGPGATLWGANAVNGVINVITRKSSEMEGFHADLRGGPDKQAASVRVAGRADDALSYELYARALNEDGAFTLAGAEAEDGWRRYGGGFRLDWTPSEADEIALLGEMFDGRQHRPGDARENFSGRNLTVRWSRRTGDGGLQAQLFYDRIARDERASGGGKFHTDTFDAELQHSFSAGPHRIVWGGGARLVDYAIEGTTSLFFDPADDRLFIANAFAQDSFALTSDLTLIAGAKLEHLPYAGTSLLPEVRLAWKASPTTLIWASVARAVRSPTPFDTDVQERVADVIALSGNPQFLTEKLVAYELGARLQPTPTFSISATAFRHRYDDLRTVELTTGPAQLNLTWQNGLEGSTYGIEAWADWRVTPWWTLSGGASLLERDFKFKPGASGILGTSQLGSDPPYKATLRSSMNLRRDVLFDLSFRAIGKLPDPQVPAYAELSGRLAWQVSPHATLSLSGTNLLHDRHQEYPAADAIPRRVMGGLELQF